MLILPELCFFDIDSDGLLPGFFLRYIVAAIVVGVCYGLTAKRPPGLASRNLWSKLMAIPGDLAVLAFVVLRVSEAT